MQKKVMLLVISALASVLVMSGCGNQSSSGTAAGNANTEAAAAGGDAEWPKKNIQIIVPFKAGGDSDFNARAYSQFLQDELGQSVVVVNVEGAGGSVGTRQVKDSAADGYTVLFNHTSFLINKANGTSDFGFEEFELAGIVAGNPGDIVAVKGDSGITTLEELKQAAEVNPYQMTVSTTIGSTTQVSVEMMIEAGIPLNAVDVGNASDKIASLLGGHVDVIVVPYGNARQYIESGDFNALAVISRKDRCPAYPDIPTAEEQGFDVYFPTKYFMAFPKGTDQAVIDKFTAALKNISENNEAYAAMIMESYYEEPEFMDAESALEFYGAMEDTLDKYSLKNK